MTEQNLNSQPAPKQTSANPRALWLLAGLVAGLALSWVWPHEPMHAATGDRDSKYALVTCPVKDVEFGGVKDSLEGVFVLDFLTGQLKGAVLNSTTGKFTHAYSQNVALDLQVDPNGTPKYTIAAGMARLPNLRGVTMSQGVIYIGEMNSGKVVAYGFPYAESNRPVGPFNMVRLDFFQFREVIK